MARVDWDILRRMVLQGRVFRASTDQRVLAPGSYLNMRLLCPSGSEGSLEPLGFHVSSDQAIWGQMRTNPTQTGTPTGASAVCLLVGADVDAIGTISWSVNGTLPYGGNLYDEHRVPVSHYVDYSEEAQLEVPLAIRLAAGNAIGIGYGPAAVTTNIAVAIEWAES